MVDVLKSRIAFLSLIFSAGGAALTRIFALNTIGWDITAIAWIISLLVSLFVSAVFRARMKKKASVIVSSILFIGSLASLALYMSKTAVLTCEFQTFSDTTATIQIVHGTSADYTALAHTFIKYNPALAKDPCTLLDSFGRENTEVWTNKGIDTAKQQLMFHYILFVIVFVACITYLCGYLAQNNKRKIYPGAGTVPKPAANRG